MRTGHCCSGRYRVAAETDRTGTRMQRWLTQTAHSNVKNKERKTGSIGLVSTAVHVPPGMYFFAIPTGSLSRVSDIDAAPISLSAFPNHNSDAGVDCDQHNPSLGINRLFSHLFFFSSSYHPLFCRNTVVFFFSIFFLIDCLFSGSNLSIESEPKPQYKQTDQQMIHCGHAARSCTLIRGESISVGLCSFLLFYKFAKEFTQRKHFCIFFSYCGAYACTRNHKQRSHLRNEKKSIEKQNNIK